MVQDLLVIIGGFKWADFDRKILRYSRDNSWSRSPPGSIFILWKKAKVNGRSYLIWTSLLENRSIRLRFSGGTSTTVSFPFYHRSQWSPVCGSVSRMLSSTISFNAETLGIFSSTLTGFKWASHAWETHYLIRGAYPTDIRAELK